MQKVKKRILSKDRNLYSCEYDVDIYLPEIIGWDFNNLSVSHHFSADQIAMPKGLLPRGDKLRVIKDAPYDCKSMALLKEGHIVELIDVQETESISGILQTCLVDMDGERFEVHPQYLSILNPYTKESLQKQVDDILAPCRDAKRLKEFQMEMYLKVGKIRYLPRDCKYQNYQRWDMS